MISRITRLIAPLLLAITATCAVAADATIYLVRHAEKVADGTSDPALTAEGEARAAWIADYMADKGLKAVYSTNYKRTRDTAAPSSATAGVEIQLYDPRKLQEFAESLKSLEGPVLVVGHSNTTPILAGLLVGEKYEELDESIYDHIYVVTLHDDGTATVRIDHSEPRTAIDPAMGVRNAMAARLALMADVAAYKWLHDLPIADPAREAELTEKTVGRAMAEGLDAAYARKLVEGQMMAAKTVQSRLFAAWKAGTVPVPVAAPDLATSLRPKISALTAQLVVAVKDADAAFANCAVQQSLRQVPPTLTADAYAWSFAAEGVIAGQACN